MAQRDALRRTDARRRELYRGGGERKIEEQHAKGKLTARERLHLLVDDGTLIEQQSFVVGRSNEFGLDTKKVLGDGVVTGSGLIHGRQVFCSSQDFTVLGGSLGEMHADRIVEAQRLALETGCPFIQINDSGGARIQEGVLSLEGYARIFRANTLASGVVPQISIILGPCAGGAVYSPGITDFVCVVDGISKMYITGPDVIRSVTGEDVTHDELGGAHAHAVTSGVAHLRFSDEETCLAAVRRLLSYLPASNREEPPLVACDDPPDRPTPELFEIIPDDERRAYDVHGVIETIFDRESFFEIHREYAANVVVGFARLAGRTVGVFANQPAVSAAVLDINAADKAARFLRFCDAFAIPIVSLADVPGFLPGVAQEHDGIIRHGAKILYAIAEATVPKISLVMRKAYGGAFIAMAAKGLGYDRVLAWPSAEIAVMGAEGAANVIFRREIASAENPDVERTEKVAEFRKTVMDPFVSASYGLVDDVVDPTYTRSELVRSLEMLAGKRQTRPERKHGNLPV